jgi:glycosyltransferase A (GT-A) superfamily protein (DUF2064 family)
MNEHVMVVAKAPVPGHVKTRLCPPYTPEQAAEIAAAALADTLEAMACCSAARKVVALDGRPGPWLPPGVDVISQISGPFTARLANAWASAGSPGVQIGMDTPQISPDQIDRALGLVVDRPQSAVLGPALDGGWWLIGWHHADPWDVFNGVPMSTARTGLVQECRLRQLGFAVATIDTQRDIDTASDLAAVARAHPGLRVARLARVDEVVL